MQKQQTRQHEMLVRVRDFGIAYRDRFPTSTLGGDAFAVVGAAVKDLDEEAATQNSNRRAIRGGPIQKTAEGAALIEMLESISRTAKAVALDMPEAEERFRLPERAGKGPLLNTARTFARDAGPFATAFVAHGLPKDFVAQLTAKIDGFEQAIKAREAVRQQRAVAHQAVLRALESGLAAVQRLDAIVANVIGADDGARLTWEIVRRLEHHGSVRSSTATSSGIPESMPAAAAGNPMAPSARPEAGSTGEAAEREAAEPAPIAKIA